MDENKIKIHQRRFKIFNVICIILSIIITFLLFMFLCGWAKGDGQDVVFNFRTILLFLGVAFGFYVSMLLPGYLFHKILVMLDKNK